MYIYINACIWHNLHNIIHMFICVHYVYTHKTCIYMNETFMLQGM